MRTVFLLLLHSLAAAPCVKCPHLHTQLLINCHRMCPMCCRSYPDYLQHSPVFQVTIWQSACDVRHMTTLSACTAPQPPICTVSVIMRTSHAKVSTVSDIPCLRAALQGMFAVARRFFLLFQMHCNYASATTISKTIGDFSYHQVCQSNARQLTDVRPASKFAL